MTDYKEAANSRGAINLFAATGQLPDHSSRSRMELHLDSL